MQFILKDINKKRWLAAVVFLLFLALLLWRLIMPKSGLDAQGPAIWIRISFLLMLCLYIQLAALGLGRFLLKYFDLSLLTRTEFGLLASVLGLGCLSAGIMILALASWLNAFSIFLWLTAAGLIAWSEWSQMGWRAAVDHSPREKNVYTILLQVVAAICVPLLLLEGLLPVWDYDALLYHLEIPRQFLAHGGFYFDPEVLRSAYPYQGEMLFLVGIAFDLDSLSRLITLTYAVLFVLSSYTFSQRLFGRRAAYTTAGILIGAPAFWIWATWAGVDFAWAVYEFWSVYCVSFWLAEGINNSRKWLTLAGIMSGFAAGTKYLSLPALLVVGLIIAWKSFQDSGQPVKQMLSNLLIFGLAAGVAAGGWYIRNWLWTGNPVYPLIFGGPGWDPLKNQILNDYVYSFGVGKNWLDFLLLPYNIYAFQNRFATIRFEVFHPVLWLAVLFPLLAKLRRKYDVVFVYSALGFVSWAANSQVIRYLIPLMAFWAILAAAVIETLPGLWRNLLRTGLIGGFMLFNLIAQLLWMQDYGSWRYLAGDISASQYLQNVSHGFDTIREIEKSLENGDKVQFLWDGRGYYCDARCAPDDEESTAVRLAFDSPAPEMLAHQLREDGITHLLLSKPGASWFVGLHDPQGLHHKAYTYYTNRFFPSCGKPVYTGRETYLIEITCP
jgi:hypothetical protein